MRLSCIHADVAQLVEPWICNPVVEGPSPFVSLIWRIGREVDGTGLENRRG